MKEQIFNKYIDLVIEKYQVTEADILGSEIARSKSVPRHMVFALCHEEGVTPTELEVIMRSMGSEIQRPAITKAITKFKKKMRRDKNLTKIFLYLSAANSDSV